LTSRYVTASTISDSRLNHPGLELALKDQYLLVFKMLRRNIEHADAEAAEALKSAEEPSSAKDRSEPPFNLADNPNTTDNIVHIKLRSPFKHYYGMTLQRMERQQLLAQNEGFKDFRSKTFQFVEKIYNVVITTLGAENVCYFA
jgi:hypothetical protein